MSETSCAHVAPHLTVQKRARVIAHYLPQFHPIPENDAWWGRGFTEWTNVAKAKPLYRGHYQPRVPADLGFYDLRVPETRRAQADMAREYGVEAFCYWHYWFAGKRLLEQPFNEVLRSGEPDFPFCLGWANATWSGVWYGAPKTILQEQTYPGMDDYKAHFEMLLEAFEDPRYLTVDGKPFFLIFRPMDLPDAKKVTDFWRELAVKNGLKGLHIVGLLDKMDQNPNDYGLDAASLHRLDRMFRSRKMSPSALVRKRLSHYSITGHLMKSLSRKPIHVYPYDHVSPNFVIEEALDYEYYPTIIPNWDNTARSGSNGVVLHGSTPELFQQHVRSAVNRVADLPPEHRIIIAKSWNEWAEGNHLEPDLRYGLAYLEALRAEIFALGAVPAPKL